MLNKNAIKPNKLIQLAKCIEDGNRELDKSKLEIIEKNLKQLDEIEKKGLERVQSIIERTNSFKENFPKKISKLRAIESEKLAQLKREFEQRKEDSLVDGIDGLGKKEKSDLMNIKKELDKKLSALKLSKKINQSKLENGPEFKLIMEDDAVLDNLSGVFIQNIAPSILVRFYLYYLS